MTSIKDLQEGLLSALDERLSAYGLKRPSRSQSFYSQTPWGKSAFHISFIKHKADCDLTADVAVRIDALEDLVNDANPKLSTADKKKTFSLGAELGNILEGRPRRWTLVSPHDVEPVARAVTEAFRTIGLPYLEKHANPQHAFEALRSNDRSAWLHSPFHTDRCKQIVALAVLLDRSDQLDQIIAENTRFLQERKDSDLADFLAFAQRIKERAKAAPIS